MMRIDAHMHVNYEKTCARELIDYLDENRFDCCWLLTWEESAPQGWPYQHLSAEDVYETYLQYPTRIIPMYAPDPNQDDASVRLRAWCKKGFRGCAELKAAINWQSDKVRALLSTVSELRLPLLFHMQESSDMVIPLETDSPFEVLLTRLMKTDRLWGLPRNLLDFLTSFCSPLARWRAKRTLHFPGYMLDFASLGKALEAFPEVNFVGHGPLFWKHLSGDVAAGGPVYPRGQVKEGGLTCKFLQEYDNLYADLSGAGVPALTRDTKFAKRFLEKFSHKLLFGSDNIKTKIESLIESFKLPSQTLRQIFGENALGLIEQAVISEADSEVNSVAQSQHDSA
ncbi:MAG: amidohydrolase family protein [bacterium]